MGQAVWQTGADGLLASDLGEYRLLVERVNGWVRYQVFRRGNVADAGSPVLLASGNHEDVRAAMDAAERVAEPADGGRGWPEGERAGTMTVLLAEQDPLVRQTLQSMLGRAGFRVVDAVAFPENLSLPQAAVDTGVLVISTQRGGDKTVADLILEARRCWPRLRVMLISACVAGPDEMAMVDHFLPKPFSGKALIQTLRDLEAVGQALSPAPLPHPVQGWAA